MWYKKLKCNNQKVPKQAEAKRDGVINVIHSTKISVVLLALKAKGQKYLMSLLYICFYDIIEFLSKSKIPHANFPDRGTMLFYQVLALQVRGIWYESTTIVTLVRAEQIR